MKRKLIKAIIIFVTLFSFLSAPGATKADALESSGITLDVLDLKNMDVTDVLKLISQKSGLNIVASQNVKGRVTVFLKDIEVLAALRIIVEAYGWAYAKDGGVIKVVTAQEYEDRYGHKFGQNLQTRVRHLLYTDSQYLLTILNEIKSASGKIIADDNSNSLIIIDVPLKLEEMEKVIKSVDVPTITEIFTLSYANAEDIYNKISEEFTPNVGTGKFDVRSNTIVVSDTSQKIKDIGRIIDAFDQKDKEVLIEAKIIQIVLSDEHKYGVDWQAIVSNYQQLDLTGDFDILTSTDKKGQLSIGTIAEDDFTVLIEALETVGSTNILSSPRIATIHNQEAKILVGSTEPYVTSTTTTPASGPTTTAETVNFIEVGVKLFVTPLVHKDNFITMKVKPEVSSVVRNITTGSNNTIPVVETSEAETTVTVKDRVTIVIGGLIKESNITTTKQIPFLGSVPFLGNAFKNFSDTDEKSEIAIFLTPKIFTGGLQDEVTYSLE